MNNPQPVDVPTPRTDSLKPEGAYHNWSIDQLFKHSRQLEKELIAATAELERTKEQLRVARGIYECVRHTASMGDLGGVLSILDSFFSQAFTQPQSGAVDPVKGEEG